MADRNIDLAAVGRVARRVDLLDIRLAEIFATSQATSKGLLEPDITHECVPVRSEGGILEVDCSYQFTVKSAEVQVAHARFNYKVTYELSGDEPLAQADVEQFAFANGTYHSWPFVRELLYGLTARMGFPPYVLPVMKFHPPRPVAQQAQPPSADASPPRAT